MFFAQSQTKILLSMSLGIWNYRSESPYPVLDLLILAMEV
jgi:hypothetical protein